MSAEGPSGDGLKLAGYAHAHGKTRTELSNRTGISESVISRLFTGKQKLQFEHYEKLVLACNGHSPAAVDLGERTRPSERS